MNCSIAVDIESDFVALADQKVRAANLNSSDVQSLSSCLDLHPSGLPDSVEGEVSGLLNSSVQLRDFRCDIDCMSALRLDRNIAESGSLLHLLSIDVCNWSRNGLNFTDPKIRQLTSSHLHSRSTRDDRARLENELDLREPEFLVGLNDARPRCGPMVEMHVESLIVR